MPTRKTTEQFIKEALELHCERYDYSKVEYIGAHDKVIIICKIHGEFNQTPRNHLFGKRGKGQGCPQCMAFEKFDNLRLTNEKIDQYLLDNNIQIKRIGDYINVITNIKWQCLQCSHLWNITPNHIRQGGGCPICKDTRLTNEDVDSFIIEHNLSLKRVGEYVNAYTKINWQCLVCNHIWLAQPCEIKRLGDGREGSGCPECARGKNEKRVGEVLSLLGLEYNHTTIKLNNRKYYPDFYIPSLNLMIEYNGIQHYQPTCFGSMSQLDAEVSFQRQLKRDCELRDYCSNNGIDLLEIDGRKYKGQHLKKFLLEELK